MRNRYQRDLNRLVQHPRRMQAGRKLRSPGALNGTFSAASGLPREPAPSPNLSIYILELGRVHKMSPDMLTVEETLYSNIDTTDFAVTNGQLLVTLTGGDQSTNSIFVGQGVNIDSSFSSPNFINRPYCAANANNFLLFEAHGSNGTGSAEKYSLSGAFEGAVDMAGSDLDFSSFWPSSFTANNSTVAGCTLWFQPSDWSFVTVSLSGSGRENLIYNASHYQGPTFLTSSRFYHIDTEFSDSAASIAIYDLAYNFIGSWVLQNPGQFYETFCVTESKGYAFIWDSSPPTGDPYSRVEIYDRVNDTFTFLNTVDLVSTHGFGGVLKTMPDMKSVLESAA